jgi:hypothetical protein
LVVVEVISQFHQGLSAGLLVDLAIIDH